MMTEHEIVQQPGRLDQHFQLGANDRPVNATEATVHELDSPENQELHRKLIRWREYEAQVQQHSREQAAIDEAYRDHEQYTAEELQTLAERYQAPAIANEIKPIVDYYIGIERRMRVEGKALPREEGDRIPARAKTSLLKFLADANNEPMHRSMAFKEMVTTGLSWLYCGARSENEDGEAVKVCHESWRNVIYDSHHQNPDYTDARYWFRDRFVDTDVAELHFSDRKAFLETQMINGAQTAEDERNASPLFYLGQRLSDRYATESAMARHAYGQFTGLVPDAGRRRTRVTEAWWKQPTEILRVTTPGQFFGLRIDTQDEHFQWLLNKAGVKYDRTWRMVPWVAIMTDAGFLSKQVSPYQHNRFPAVPMACFRKSSDGTYYGVVRGIRDQQDLINKRRSKAVFLMASNQVIMDKGAMSPDELRVLRQQIAQPNGVIEVPRALQRFEIRRDVALAVELERAAVQDKAYMREVSGASTEALGMQSNATSGKAVIARQNQSTIVSAEIYDNYGFALRLAGELNLANAEQFMPEERMIRVLNDRGVEQFTQINGVDEQGNPVNPITESRADFHLSIEDFRESARRAASEELMELLSKLAPVDPQLVRAVLDLYVDSSDSPYAEQIAKRIRSITGQRDEDAVPTPEEQQQLQAQQQAQAEKDALAKRGAEAEVAAKELAAEKLRADIKAAEAQGTKWSAEQLLTAIKAINEAVTGGQLVLASPAAAKVGAELLAGADVPGGNQTPTVPTSLPAQPEPMPQAPPDQAAPMTNQQEIPNAS